MKRKQIALLLSLVLSVSPMAEGAVVWELILQMVQ